MRHILSIVAVVFTVLSMTSSAGADKLTVSVMDLKVTSGVSPSEAQQLTNKLLSDLVNFDAFVVIDRAKRDEILKEQGFQMTGACDQGSCLVQAGQLLGVQKMIGGCIGKVGLVYSVEMQLVEVRTGTIDLAFSRTYDGDVSQLLSAMREAAQDFSSWGASPKVVVTPEPPELGSMRVKTKPKGALIALDGRYLGMTPVKLSKVEAGEHIVTLSKAGYMSQVKTVTVTVDQQTLVETTLESVADSIEFPTNDLAAYYPFIGNAQDASGNGNDGSVHGAELCPDRFNHPSQAYRFDGDENYIEVPYDRKLDLSKRITLSVWVKLGGHPDYYKHIINKAQWESGTGWDGNYWIAISPDGYWTFSFGTSVRTPDAVDHWCNERLEPGRWYHLACTFDTKTDSLVLYQDGQKNAVYAEKQDLITDHFPLWLARSGHKGDRFTGEIDDVRIFKRALTPQEISALYHEGGWK